MAPGANPFQFVEPGPPKAHPTTATFTQSGEGIVAIKMETVLFRSLSGLWLSQGLLELVPPETVFIRARPWFKNFLRAFHCRRRPL
jgi:hypothetical protein